MLYMSLCILKCVALLCCRSHGGRAGPQGTPSAQGPHQHPLLRQWGRNSRSARKHKVSSESITYNTHRGHICLHCNHYETVIVIWCSFEDHGHATVLLLQQNCHYSFTVWQPQRQGTGELQCVVCTYQILSVMLLPKYLSFIALMSLLCYCAFSLNRCAHPRGGVIQSLSSAWKPNSGEHFNNSTRQSSQLWTTVSPQPNWVSPPEVVDLTLDEDTRHKFLLWATCALNTSLHPSPPPPWWKPFLSITATTCDSWAVSRMTPYLVHFIVLWSKEVCYIGNRVSWDAAPWTLLAECCLFLTYCRTLCIKAILTKVIPCSWFLKRYNNQEGKTLEQVEP